MYWHGKVYQEQWKLLVLTRESAIWNYGVVVVVVVVFVVVVGVVVVAVVVVVVVVGVVVQRT